MDKKVFEVEDEGSSSRRWSAYDWKKIFKHENVHFLRLPYTPETLREVLRGESKESVGEEKTKVSNKKRVPRPPKRYRVQYYI